MLPALHPAWEGPSPVMCGRVGFVTLTPWVLHHQRLTGWPATLVLEPDRSGDGGAQPYWVRDTNRDLREPVIKCQRISKQAACSAPTVFCPSGKPLTKSIPSSGKSKQHRVQLAKLFSSFFNSYKCGFIPKKRKEATVSQSPSANKFLSASIFGTQKLSVAWHCLGAPAGRQQEV